MMLVIFLIALVLFSCGGGKFSTDKTVSVGASITPSSVETTVDKSVEATLTITASTGDVINSDVNIKNIKLVYKSLSGSQERVVVKPVNVKLKTGQSVSIPITVYSHTDVNVAPYAYLSEPNPSTFNMVFVERVLATQISTNLTCSGATCSGNFSQNVTLGTCKVVAGSLTLEERTMLGVLEGDGSGTISGTAVNVNFSSAPTRTPIASCLKEATPLPSGYYYLQLTYGDLAFAVDAFNVIKDAQGRSVGEVVGGVVRFYSVIGYKDAPLVASFYEGELRGGEVLGYGRGQASYTLQIPYVVVDPNSVKVIAGPVSCVVVSVEPTTGKLQISCPQAISSGTPIYVQYKLSETLQDVEVYVESDRGTTFVGKVRLKVVR